MVKPATPIKVRESDPIPTEFWEQMATMFRWDGMDTSKPWGGNVGYGYAMREVWGTCVYDRVMQPSEGDVVIDAGAQIGSFTVRASQMVGESGRVYAFEPAAHSYAYLLMNTEKLKNVQIFQKPLWSSKTDGVSFFYNPKQYSVTRLNLEQKITLDNIPTTTLDDEIAGKVDFMKIDVEGSEFEVLKGAKRILETYHPFIAMEIHTWELVKDIETLLFGLGYVKGPKSPVFTYWTQPMTTSWGTY